MLSIFSAVEYVVCNIRCHNASEKFSMISLLFMWWKKEVSSGKKLTKEHEINHIPIDWYGSIFIKTEACFIQTSLHSISILWVDTINLIVMVVYHLRGIIYLLSVRKKKRIQNWMCVISLIEIGMAMDEPICHSTGSIAKLAKSIKTMENPMSASINITVEFLH